MDFKGVVLPLFVGLLGGLLCPMFLEKWKGSQRSTEKQIVMEEKLAFLEEKNNILISKLELRVEDIEERIKNLERDHYASVDHV